MPKEKCPNCGYCPHCGRSNPVYPKPWYPYNPYPYNPPYWYGRGGTTTKITSDTHSNVEGKGWSGTAINSMSVASPTYSA